MDLTVDCGHFLPRHHLDGDGVDDAGDGFGDVVGDDGVDDDDDDDCTCGECDLFRGDLLH